MLAASWEWDDHNLDELWKHGVTRRDVLDVAAGVPKFRRNRRRRAASHQMVGADRGGQFWTICIVHVRDGQWRAVTGWRSERHEVDWYNKA